MTEKWNSEEHEACPHLRVELMTGRPNLKYYGRFAIGLFATTPYVVLLDDDYIPGPRFFELCLHTINTKEYAFRFLTSNS